MVKGFLASALPIRSVHFLEHWGTKPSRACLNCVGQRETLMSDRFLSAGGQPAASHARYAGGPPGICPIYNVRLLSSDPATARAYSVQTWQVSVSFDPLLCGLA
jgi:hypothetical protein